MKNVSGGMGGMGSRMTRPGGQCDSRRPWSPGIGWSISNRRFLSSADNCYVDKGTDGLLVLVLELVVE